MVVGVADQRLRGEVEDDLGPDLGDQRGGARLVANIDDFVADQLRQRGLLEEARVGRRFEREAGDVCAQVMQPQAQPSALEAGVAGDEDALAGPGAGVHQHFHGAPCCHRSSR